MITEPYPPKLSSVSETVHACSHLRTLGLAASLPGTLCTQFGSLISSPLGAGLLRHLPENFPSLPLYDELNPPSLSPSDHRRSNDLHHIYHNQRTTGLFVSLFRSLNFCIEMGRILITATFVPIAPKTSMEPGSY